MYFKLKDFDFKDKKVIIRVDFNVPIQDGKITDDSRILKALPTIRYVLAKDPRQIVLISHLGRPKGEYSPEFSLRPVSEKLQDLLVQDIYFETNPRINNLQNIPDKKIVMLENIRFDKVEEENNPIFAKRLSEFGDFYVLDAFGVSHREHASVVAIQKFLPSCAGLLMEKEILFLRDNLKRPAKPYVAIIGGAKSDKISVINKLMQKVDKLIVGGVLANTFLKAKGVNIGSSKFDKGSLGYAKELLDKYPNKITMPIDFILADRFATDARTRVAGETENIDGWMIMDIGPYSITSYKKILGKAKTVVWAGPIGVYEWEAFRRGTWDIAYYLSQLDITKIIGGGDSAAAIMFFNLEDKMTHVSTGGGASLELLAGNELPGIKALEENYKAFKKRI